MPAESEKDVDVGDADRDEAERSIMGGGVMDRCVRTRRYIKIIVYLVLD